MSPTESNVTFNLTTAVDNKACGTYVKHAVAFDPHPHPESVEREKRVVAAAAPISTPLGTWNSGVVSAQIHTA
jgi:hypothetical protein